MAASTRRREIALYLMVTMLVVQAAQALAAVPLGGSTDWWDYEELMSLWGLAASLLGLFGLILFVTVPRRARERRLAAMAVFFIALATVGWGLRAASAFDLIWVGFGERQTMQTVGIFGFAGATVTALLSLSGLAAGFASPAIQQLLMWGLGLVAIGGGLSLLVGFAGAQGGFTTTVDLLGHAVFAGGLLLGAIVTFRTVREVDLSQTIAEAF